MHHWHQVKGTRMGHHSYPTRRYGGTALNIGKPRPAHQRRTVGWRGGAIALLLPCLWAGAAWGQVAPPSPSPLSSPVQTGPNAVESPAPNPPDGVNPPSASPVPIDPAPGNPASTAPGPSSPTQPTLGETLPAPDPTAFPDNPLETGEPDPLLPQLVIDRPLSPQERSIVTAAVEELRQTGAARLQQGDLRGAFAIWLRELRLRRVLGIEEEIPALGRVGEIAWRESQTTEVRAITERLQAIEAEVTAKPPVNDDLLLAIAQAYAKMRAIAPAVTLYSDLLTKARQAQNRPLEKAALLNLGSLYLALFDFTRAAPPYEQLVAIAQAEGDRANEITYLRQLAYIHQQGNRAELAIAVQQRLVSLYEGQQQYIQIPPLKLAIGDAYLSLNRPDLAAPNYQEAFAVSRTGQQYGYAGDALQRLADLYRSLNRLDDALVVYRLLFDVRQQSYDTLGMMNVYDQMGQIFKLQNNAAQAIAFFQRGLQLAQQLSYGERVTYFSTQIQQANQPPAAPPPTAPPPPTPPQS